MTMTSYTLDDLGERLSYRALLSFLRYLPSTSMTRQQIQPDTADRVLWETERLVPQLLASLYDQIAMFRWEFASSRTKKSMNSSKPKPLKRPGIEDPDKHYGKDPIPVSEFNEWWDSEM